MSHVPAKVSAALRRLFPSGRGLRLGVAVSGGPDSVALLGALVELAARRSLQLTVLHVNHALRPEADDEQRLVESLCRQWRLPCLVETLSPPQKRSGVETWARTERYRFFRQAKEQHSLEAVALAHTRDDQAETVLFRLLRGAGHRGLAGMPAQREQWIVRPLLDCSRQEVMSYLAVKNLPCAADASNTDLRFTRNKIRHMLLPLLEREFSPQIRRHLVQLAESLRQEEEWIEEQARAAYDRVQEQGSVLSLPRLLAEPRALRPRLLRLWCERNGRAGQIGARHLKSLCALGEGRITGDIELPGALVARREGESLLLASKRSYPVFHPYRYTLTVGESFMIPEADWEVRLSLPLSWQKPLSDVHLPDSWRALFDLDALPGPLTVRNFQPGDRIRPLGMQGHKKVHDIFIDKKIVPRRRRLWPLVVCEAEIVWIPGCVRGEQAKVTAATQRVLQLSANPLPENQKLC